MDEGQGQQLKVKGSLARVRGTAGGDAKLTAMNKKKNAPGIACPCPVPGPLNLHTLCPTRRFWRQIYFQRSRRRSLRCRSCENG